MCCIEFERQSGRKINGMKYLIEAVDQSNESMMIDFLKKHEDYTLFLLGNYENYGLTLSESPYSGNYKVIRSPDGEIVGVFCLTKKGNLLIESTIREPVFEMVLSSCREEQLPLKGVLGRWSLCKPFWDYLKAQKIIEEETFISKETLYAVDLSTTPYEPHPNVRVLMQDDFIQWKLLRLDYLLESGVPNDLSDDQLLKGFLSKVERKITWGFFLEGKLVSIADLNAKALDLGQVGGVYTVPAFRQKGYSKAAMQQLVLDSKKNHSIRKLVIFTGEDNFSAQKLYQSLGVSQIGHFALLFGKSKN